MVWFTSENNLKLWLAYPLYSIQEYIALLIHNEDPTKQIWIWKILKKDFASLGFSARLFYAPEYKVYYKV